MASAPNRLPSVAMSRCKADTMMVPRNTATMEAGTRAPHFAGHSLMNSTVPKASARDGQFVSPRCSARKTTFSRNSAGTPVTSSPRKSFTCVLKMYTAMPAVKPITTGSGMYLIITPSRATPIAIRISPAIKVQTIRFSGP